MSLVYLVLPIKVIKMSLLVPLLNCLHTLIYYSGVAFKCPAVKLSIPGHKDHLGQDSLTLMKIYGAVKYGKFTIGHMVYVYFSYQCLF